MATRRERRGRGSARLSGASGLAPAVTCRRAVSAGRQVAAGAARQAATSGEPRDPHPSAPQGRPPAVAPATVSVGAGAGGRAPPGPCQGDPPETAGPVPGATPPSPAPGLWAGAEASGRRETPPSGPNAEPPVPGPRPAAPGPSPLRGRRVVDTLAPRSGKGLCLTCEAAAGRDAAWRAGGEALARWRLVGLDVAVTASVWGSVTMPLVLPKDGQNQNASADYCPKLNRKWNGGLCMGK